MTYAHYISFVVICIWLYFLYLILFDHDKISTLLGKVNNENAIGADSIQDAVEVVSDGVLFADLEGRTLLVNSAMLGLMEQIFGCQYRNAKVFYDDLLALGSKGRVKTRLLEDQIYVNLEDGSWYRFSTKKLLLTKGSAVWQYLLEDVTEEMFVNNALEEQNKEIEAKNEELKQALLDLEIAQKEKTTDAVLHKIHDLLGQRISILQQVLSNQELQNYEYIAPLINDVMLDLRKDLIIPEDNFKELIEAYRGIGINVEVTGELPKNQKEAEIFVNILRDALSNAVRHGKAGRIKIHMGYSLTVEDDGVGCQNINMGTGLSGMQKLLQENGGKLMVDGREHFTLRADL